MATNEEYRRAALALTTAKQTQHCRTLILSSATRGEGTSSAAIFIGRHLMKDFGCKPVVIEINRLRPIYSRLFKLDDSKSLAALASGNHSAIECVQHDPTGLALIPGGDNVALAAVTDLGALLSRAVQELQNHFDFILLDAPPILESADTLVAGRVVPYLVLIAAAGHTSRESLARARQELEDADITLVGAILNKHRRIIPGWIYRWLTH
jgi:succinoglycan biosynthesis transport protein ExoP